MKTVIEMAREAGFIAQEGYQGTGWFWVENNLEHFAELVRADAIAEEREACARIAEEPSATTYECTVACGGPAQTFTQRFPKHSHDIAKEIRARGHA